MKHGSCRKVGAILVVCFVSILTCPSRAEEPIDWDSVDIITHSEYQAVNPDGSSAYTGGFPIRLRGVVLNNSEDWLDPTAAYDPGVTLWEMGGEAELFIQSVGPADVGGTAAWMGQNYGNHRKNQDPYFSYLDAEWYAELDRLHLYRPGTTVTPIIRAGMLVEVRARGGLHYAGKMNVNEEHSNLPEFDFEYVILDENYGLPAAEIVRLNQLRDAADQDIFDHTRQSGGERYQSRRIDLQDLRLGDVETWHTDSDIAVDDPTGRTFSVHLGLDSGFDTFTLAQRIGSADYAFDAIGVLDHYIGGPISDYRLLVMQAADVRFAGDLDGDAFGSAGDIDAFFAAAVDLDGDGVAETADLLYLVESLMHRQMGDTNLDGSVDEADLAWVADGWKLGTGYAWGSGDFTGDGAVNEADLAYLADNWKQPLDPPTTAVPEPAGVALLTLMVGAVHRRRRRIDS